MHSKWEIQRRFHESREVKKSTTTAVVVFYEASVTISGQSSAVKPKSDDFPISVLHLLFAVSRTDTSTRQSTTNSGLESKDRRRLPAFRPHLTFVYQHHAHSTAS